jgi:hypothetical protein
LTADKDFGELIFRQHLLHCGILLVRLAGLTPDLKAALVADAFKGMPKSSARDLQFFPGVRFDCANHFC